MTSTSAVECSLSSMECKDHFKVQMNAHCHLMTLIVINFTNSRLVYAHLSQEEANTLNISQPLSLSRRNREKVG